MSTQSAPTGQTAPASSATSPDQGSSSTNPFEIAPPAHVAENEPSQSAPAQGEQTTAAPQGEQTPATQPGQTPVESQPAAGVDPKALTQSIVDGLVQAQTKIAQQFAAQPGQQQQQAAPAMSPEQFRQHYEIPQVDAATYEAILGAAPDKPERVAALDNLMMGFMRAGVKMGQDLLKHQLGQFQQQYDTRLQPLMSAHQQAQEAAIVTRFTTAHPDLANEMALVNDVRDAMIARGTKFSSEQEMFKAIGDATRQLITRLRGTAGGQTNQPGSSQTGAGGIQSRPAARTMTPSMQGGRGGSASSSNKPSIAEQVFGS